MHIVDQIIEKAQEFATDPTTDKLNAFCDFYAQSNVASYGRVAFSYASAMNQYVEIIWYLATNTPIYKHDLESLYTLIDYIGERQCIQ